MLFLYKYLMRRNEKVLTIIGGIVVALVVLIGAAFLYVSLTFEKISL